VKARRVGAVVLRQVYLLRGSMSRVLPLFIWVAVDMVLWGFISRYLSTLASPGFDFIPALLGAVLLWDFFGRVMHGVTMAFFEDVWSRNFLNFFATPMRVSEYVTGLVLTSIATSTLGLVAMVVVATGAFGLSFLAYGPLLVPFLLILFMFGIALGILSAAMVLRLGPPAEWFVWPIPGMLSPFVGVFYPLSTLPDWMQIVSRLLPPSYVFESLRAMLEGRPAHLDDLGMGLALAGGYLLLAGWVFTRVYRHAVQSGLLARYSAESVS
jgi:ABC-2 type transport system permease protein